MFLKCGACGEMSNVPECPACGADFLVAVETQDGREQTLADREQTAADQDQTWSDHDQTASDRDQRKPRTRIKTPRTPTWLPGETQRRMIEAPSPEPTRRVTGTRPHHCVTAQVSSG